MAIGLLAALVPAARATDVAAGPVEDALALVDEALRCRIWADEPGGNPVVGSGGGSCNVGRLPVTAVVCLDYNGVTVGTSCRTYSGTGSASGSTNPTLCLPGLWQTQVTFTHMFMPGVESRTHSDPVLLTCLP
jgi:hypothetical protein